MRLFQTKNHRFALLLLLGLHFSIGLASMPAFLSIGDPYTWREEARSLILRGQLSVEPEAASGHGEPGQYFFLNSRDGAYYSKYGVMNGLMTVFPLSIELLVTKSLPRFASEQRYIFLNIFYLALSLIVACLLYQIARSYSTSPPACFTFVLLSLYCTFLWHHLRAGGQEPLQLLFFCGLYLGLIHYLRAEKAKNVPSLLFVYGSLLALVLTKFSFIIFLPLIVVFSFLRNIRPGIRAEQQKPLVLPRTLLLHGILPVLVLALLLFLNWWKFGDALLTGYEQWRPDDVRLTGSYSGFLVDLFFSEQWSMFAAFPLLLFALPFARKFFRRQRGEYLFLLLGFCLQCLLIGKLPIWKGEWSYGPRYLLFLLPLLALPSLHFFEWLFSLPGDSWKTASVRGITSFFIIVSFFSQFQVVRLDPFFVYWVRPLKECFTDAEAKNYFLTTHYSRIHSRLLAKKYHPQDLWFMAGLERDCGATVAEKTRRNLLYWLNRPNFYWFPGLPLGRD